MTRVFGFLKKNWKKKEKDGKKKEKMGKRKKKVDCKFWSSDQSDQWEAPPLLPSLIRNTSHFSTAAFAIQHLCSLTQNMKTHNYIQRCLAHPCKRNSSSISNSSSLSSTAEKVVNSEQVSVNKGSPTIKKSLFIWALPK